MTPEMLEYKKEVIKAMEEYLKAKGYPDNFSNEQIMTDLSNIYRHLEDKGLVRYGLNYAFFRQIAEQQFFINLMNSRS